MNINNDELIESLREGKEALWRNTKQQPAKKAIKECCLTVDDVMDASARLERFAPFLMKAFPETEENGGLIESPLKEIRAMKAVLGRDNGVDLKGRLLIKLDSHLAISGSIKARGGIYEVLETAEDVALESGMLKLDDDYSILATEPFKKLFSQYSIAVGSTGNLGLSIGIMSAKLGFNVTVHMSADARQWKKDMLRSKGVNVVEYESDYSEAVKQGRRLAEGDPQCHFIDDENSKTLFLGYSVAALRLKKQLDEMGVKVDSKHPMNVYLPCGVGGGPGGVAFGLKLIYGDSVNCFFAEPVNACCMILGMCTGKHSEISVQDIGIDGRTVADGLAVGRASGFVGKVMEPFIGGCYTLSDERMYRMLAQLADSEGIYLEPSALAGMYGAVLTERAEEFAEFKADGKTTHLVWATGGSMVPETEMKKYYLTGKELLDK